MSAATPALPTSAGLQGWRWSRRAADWAELAAGFSAPAWEVVAEATATGQGMRVLDVGCGSGEFCRLASARGASVSGLDAAEGMIVLARRRVPEGDFRVGPMEGLPWAGDTFDVVTGFNAFQFAADVAAALGEAKRVARAGGRVAICNWAAPEDNHLSAVMGSLRRLQPPPTPGSPALDPPALGKPGVIEGLARAAGLDPIGDGEIAVPLEAPDRETLERALLSPGGVAPAIEHSGEELVRKAIVAAAAPFRRPDGSYRFENRFRYVVCTA